MALETANLTVEGMSCGHCANSIKNSVNTQIIKEKIEDQGYEVK